LFPAKNKNSNQTENPDIVAKMLRYQGFLLMILNPISKLYDFDIFGA